MIVGNVHVPARWSWTPTVVPDEAACRAARIRDGEAGSRTGDARRSEEQPLMRAFVSLSSKE